MHTRFVAVAVLLGGLTASAVATPQTDDKKLRAAVEGVKKLDHTNGRHFMALDQILETPAYRPFLLPVLTEMVQNHPDAEVRGLAASALLQYGWAHPNDEAEVAKGLAKGLDDAEASLRRQAALLLAAHGRTGTKLLLAQRAHKDATVRIIANCTFVQNGGDIGEAVKEVLAGLDHADNEVVDWTLRTVRELKAAGQSFAPKLLEVARSDKAAYLRVSALELLWATQLPAEQVAPVLTELLKDKTLRLTAAGLLGSYGAASKGAVAALKGMLEDSDPVVRLTAGNALFKITGVRHEKQYDAATQEKMLRKKLEELKTADESQRSEHALLINNTPEWKAVLDAVVCDVVVNHKDSEVRELAAQILWPRTAHLKDRLADVEKALDDDSAVVRGLIGYMLLGGDAGLLVLARHGESRHDDVRTLAAVATVRLNGDAAKALSVLVAGLQCRSAMVRRLAAEAVGDMGPHAAKAVPALLAQLKDTDGWVVATVMGALAAIGPEAREAIPTLEAFLQHDDPGLRLAAQRALNRINGDA
jgi:HEAT repeat protein